MDRCARRAGAAVLLVGAPGPRHPGRGADDAGVHLRCGELALSKRLRLVRGAIDLLDEDKLPVRVRALLWSTLEASPEGLPVLLHTFSPAAERPAGIPALRSVLYLGSTLQQIDERAAAAGELLPDEPAYVPALYGALLRFLAACLSFLEQRIALAVERPASRGTRRRLAWEYPTYVPPRATDSRDRAAAAGL